MRNEQDQPSRLYALDPIKMSHWHRYRYACSMAATEHKIMILFVIAYFRSISYINCGFLILIETFDGKYQYGEQEYTI